MKIKLSQADALYGALDRLDKGYNQVVDEGDKKRVVNTNFSFGGMALLHIARNMNRLKPELVSLGEAQEKLATDMGISAGNGMLKQDADQEVVKTFLEQRKAMQESEVSIDLTPLKVSDLKIDQQPVPASALAPLDECGLLVE